MNFLTSMADLSRIASTEGLGFAARHVQHRVLEKYFDRKLGIDTDGMVPLAHLGVHDTALVDYCPVPYQAILGVLGDLYIDPSRDVFVDFGAGKGRVIVAAALQPFRRVVGVELTRELCELGRANVERARPRLRCPDVAIVQADARHFELPNDATILHFFNPFRGEVLRTVLDNTRSWLDKHHKPLTILFFNNDDFEKQLVERPWIRRLRSYSFFPAIPCGVYECC